ncbi:class I tRNA ligase family protein, partial [candidate division GN15 bacterium]|nr:class I tRNA ligase family protein [candidate division GN15 bacterium]
FYTLHAIATLVKDSVAYKNVVVNGLLLDDKGEKMSKSKGNIVNPFDTIETYGADPVRWYLISTSAPWLPIKFDFNALEEVIRKYFDTLRNTYSFFAIYANIDRVAERADEAGQSIAEWLKSKAGDPETFDRWIVSRFNTLSKEVSDALDAYDLTRPVRAIQHFVVEELSNWYVRNNRRRFWADGDDPSKMRAFLTLYRVLDGVCRLAAPFSPIMSELIWQKLTAGKAGQNGYPLSVHMLDFPAIDESLVDSQLEETMGQVEKLVRLGRAARTRHNLKVRQPLAKMLFHVPGKKVEERLAPYLGIVRDELNIKSVELAEDLDKYVSYAAKLNFKVAGPKLGKQVKQAAAFVAQLSSDEVKKFAQSRELHVDTLDGVTLTSEEVEIIRNEKKGMAVESDGGVVVALSTELTEELLNEGFARELINKIQNMRKSAGLEVTDRIRVRAHSSDRLKAAADKHADFIRHETLADELQFVGAGGLNGATDWDINGESASLTVERV